MAWFDPRLAVLVVGLLGPPAPAADLPAVAVVTAESLEVFDEPDDRSVSSGRLRQGDEVAVRQVVDGGWLVIEPPAGSFVWVEQSALRRQAGRATAKVAADDTVIRAGHPGARMPGIPQGTLPRGATVQLLDVPPLKLGNPRRTWLAVETPTGTMRYIRAEGVEWRKDAQDAEPPKETRAAFLAEPASPRMPAEIASEIERLELAHRAVLRQPIDQWRLASIRKEYQDLQKRAADAESSKAVRTRLDQVTRHEAAAEAARAIEATLGRSRERDRKLALYLRRVAQAEDPRERPYAAEGIIQPSSQRVGGEKVYALIGPEGRAVAYLNIPAGLDPRGLLARPVGVRGSVNYNESLHAQLITVRDLDPLDVRERR